jgi:hypothetical protein
MISIYLHLLLDRQLWPAARRRRPRTGIICRCRRGNGERFRGWLVSWITDETGCPGATFTWAMFGYSRSGLEWDGLNPSQVIWGFNPAYSHSNHFIPGENEHERALDWLLNRATSLVRQVQKLLLSQALAMQPFPAFLGWSDASQVLGPSSIDKQLMLMHATNHSLRLA